MKYSVRGSGGLPMRDVVENMLKSKGYKIAGGGMGGSAWDLEVHTEDYFFPRKIVKWAPQATVKLIDDAMPEQEVDDGE